MCATISAVDTEKKGSFKLVNLRRGGKAPEFSELGWGEGSQGGKSSRCKGREGDSR